MDAKFFKYVLPCLCQEKNKVGADLGPTHHRWRGWINIIVGSVSYAILILHPHCPCLIWVYDYVSKEATGKAYEPSKLSVLDMQWSEEHHSVRVLAESQTWRMCRGLGDWKVCLIAHDMGWQQAMFRHNRSKAAHARRWGFGGEQWTSRWLPHQPLRWAHSQLTGAGG